MNIRTLTAIAAALLALGLALSSARADDLVARGNYLMNSIVACGNCHAVQTPEGPMSGGELAGGMEIKDAAFTTYAANITPSGLGGWTDDEIKTAIRTGIRPDGRRLPPPMGVRYYADISEEDIEATVGYLRKLPLL